MRQSLTVLKQDERGVTAVEFALVGPILFFLMMAITEISLIIFAQSTMEGAAFTASRIGKTGYAETATTREETIRAALEKKMSNLFDPDRIVLETLSYNQFNQIGEPEPFVDVNGNGQRDENENYTDVNGNAQYDSDIGAAGVGRSSQIVIYDIHYDWPVLTPLMQPFIGENGILRLTTRAITQNEPF
jgi:Flp pilus assembly pilin Flp